MNVRLSYALSGALALPDAGRILLLRPSGQMDLSPLPLDRVVAVTGFRPDHDALARRVEVAETVEGDFAAALVCLPRAKALALDLIATACAALPEGAPVIVDGNKADGVESVLKLCRATFELDEVVSKAHGKCFAFPAAPAPDGWAATPLEADGFLTTAGVFSADGIDPGSALLAKHLGDVSGRVCDLGAGWGFLARGILASDAVTAVALVEAERAALDCARLNVTDPRASFHWADATRFDGGPFDWVVSNPPFHVSRKADPDLGRAFVAAAARLAPRGRLRLVANRHLPYEAALTDAFAETLVLEERDGYKVIEAQRPRRTR
ncbi:MAG: methyltransferase [Pseudomonadota bacterium]